MTVVFVMSRDSAPPEGELVGDILYVPVPEGYRNIVLKTKAMLCLVRPSRGGAGRAVRPPVRCGAPFPECLFPSSRVLFCVGFCCLRMLRGRGQGLGGVVSGGLRWAEGCSMVRCIPSSFFRGTPNLISCAEIPNIAKPKPAMYVHTRIPAALGTYIHAYECHTYITYIVPLDKTSIYNWTPFFVCVVGAVALSVLTCLAYFIVHRPGPALPLRVYTSV